MARSFAGHGPLLDALVSVSIARDGGAPKLANAYGRIAAVLVETMALRAAHGSARADLDTAAAAIKAAVTRGDFPPMPAPAPLSRPLPMDRKSAELGGYRTIPIGVECYLGHKGIGKCRCPV